MLKKFSKHTKSKIITFSSIMFIFILLVFITIYRSYAIYQEEKTFNVLKGIVPNFVYSKGTLEVVAYVDGVVSTSIPEKGAYSVDITCDNDATATWDYAKWGITVTNMKQSGTTCTISFKTAQTLASYIYSKTDTDELISDDETDDHNIRYIGADPNNYLCFDESCKNGKWRVIGIMNNMTTSDGDTTSLIKIIKNESIGTYALDSSRSNNWTTASLNTYLNGDWYTTNLKDYDDLIESAVWKLGGSPTFEDVTTSKFYSLERGTTVYGSYATEWTGKVALKYPSDYGYATSGGETTNRETCLSNYVYLWTNYSECIKNDYLYSSSTSVYWTLTPRSSSSSLAIYIYMGRADSNQYHYVSIAGEINPTLYLKLTTRVLAGAGTSESPWIVG